MAKVGIVMGSDSDLKVMSKAADMLEELGIEYELTIISAHREPDELIEWTRGAEDRDVKVIIAGAGMAAALPGMCAALFALPVIGVPLSGKNLDGMDAVFYTLSLHDALPIYLECLLPQLQLTVQKMQQSLQQRYSQQVMMQSLRKSKSIQQI